jgi:hypothetical protein
MRARLITAQPLAAHHYQPCTYLLGQGDDLFVRFPHPEMGLHYGASVSLDAPHLSIQ